MVFALWKVKCHLLWVCFLFTNYLIWMKNRIKSYRTFPWANGKPNWWGSSCVGRSAVWHLQVAMDTLLMFLKIALYIDMQLAIPRFFWWCELPSNIYFLLLHSVTVIYILSVHHQMILGHVTIATQLDDLTVTQLWSSLIISGDSGV